MRGETFEIPLFFGQRKLETKRFALVDKDLASWFFKVSLHWYIYSQHEPEGTPRVSMNVFDEATGRNLPINVQLNKLAYLFARLPLERIEQLTRPENFSELWDMIKTLPRIREENKNKLDCREINLKCTADKKVRQARLERVGTPFDFVDPRQDQQDEKDAMVRLIRRQWLGRVWQEPLPEQRLKIEAIVGQSLESLLASFGTPEEPLGSPDEASDEGPAFAPNVSASDILKGFVKPEGEQS